MNNKFVVIKTQECANFLSHLQKVQLSSILSTIQVGRTAQGKPASNQYVVINQDEPYFEEVKEIMKAHGHWEGD